MRPRLLACALALAGVTAACGSSGGSTGAGAPSTSENQPVTIDGVTVSGPAGVKPTISLANDSPPTSLVIKDMAVGTGAQAVASKGAVVQYVGISWTTKRQFDASWDRGQPLPFALGVGQVIAGWDQGVAGMKVGGRRLLIIPPDLGYGPSGQPPAIAPNDTLVFVVDLVGVQ